MQRRFADLKNQGFDLLVVGGGIYGAWIAYDAALRGLSTALVDKGDWAGATSSASTKLIHGGLRYLAQGNLRLVRKSLNERKFLMRAGPHRVWPLRFGVPIYGGGRMGKWPLRLGLSLYDLLGGLMGSDEAHRLLPQKEFLARFPWLHSAGLRGGALYSDAQTDDVRFVLELVHGARAAGTVCVNYCPVLAYREENGRAAGAIVKDSVGGEQTVVKARCIVQATGPWLARTSAPAGTRCRLSKGAHLIMPPLPGGDALLFQSEPDGRVIFLIPWYGHTLLGTTDTDYAGDPERVRVEPEDVAYLLKAANRVLGAAGWDESHVLGSFAGLRVLRDRARASSYALRRDWTLEEGADGCLMSLGGKLTSARQDAATIVDRVCRKLGLRKSCATRGLSLPWAPAGDYEAFRQTALANGRSLGLADDDVRWLIFRHGRRIDEIYAAMAGHPELRRRLRPDVPFLRADLLHCARNEMAVHLEDLLRRRLCLLLLHRADRAELNALATEVAPILEWDEARQNLEVECCLERYANTREKNSNILQSLQNPPL
jgi:glycerol-3-phosphate dehydrogenase